MSQTTEQDGEKTERERLRELALSDRDTAPSYWALYRYRYGEDPK